MLGIETTKGDCIMNSNTHITIVQRMLSTIIAVVMLLNVLPTAAFALESSTINVPKENTYDELLLEMGFPKEIVKVIPNEDAEDLTDTYLQDPELVEISTSTLEVNVLAEMNMFVNKTDAELLELGYSVSQIEQGKSIISMYNSTSDEELLTSGLSQDDVDFLRNALDPNTENISPQGNIPKAQLTFTQSVTDHSSEKNGVHLSVYVYFTWETPYYWTDFNDKVVVSWGGNLQQTSASNQVNYYVSNLNYTEYGNECVAVVVPQYTEPAINAMGIYEFPQKQVQPIDVGIIRTGRIAYNLWQSQYTNTRSKVIAYYLHQILVLTGEIAFTGNSVTPAVSIGTGYDRAFVESQIKY